MLIDNTKSGIQNLLAQINLDNNTSFTEADVTLSTPQVRVPDAKPANTSCTFTPKVDPSKATTINWVRLNFSQCMSPKGQVTALPADDTDTPATIKQKCCDFMNLVSADFTITGDFTRPPNDVPSRPITLVANADSHLYIGQYTLDLVWTPKAVSQFLFAASPTIQAALTPTLPWQLDGQYPMTTYPANNNIDSGSTLEVTPSTAGASVRTIMQLVVRDSSTSAALPIDQQPIDWHCDVAGVIAQAADVQASTPDSGPPYYATMTVDTTLPLAQNPVITVRGTTRGAIGALPVVMTFQFGAGITPPA